VGTTSARKTSGLGGGVLVDYRGKGTLEDNDIFNYSSGVDIAEGSAATLRNNRIHDGKQNGVFVSEGGKGTLEGNDIFANAFSGVQITGEGSEATLRNNRIHHNKRDNVNVKDKGGGRIEDNDLSGHGWRWKALSVTTDSEPNLNSARNKT